MIDIEHVSFQYANAEGGSLSDISIRVKPGECVLLCGESGCGKTTLTRVINGLIPHYYEGNIEGIVKVNDINVIKAELYDTARYVGSVFQNPRSQFFCVDTTSEIAFGCENQGLQESIIKNQINEVTEDLKMKELLDKNIFKLSGGEKQKVACASVAAVQPDIFVLDEPTSNLDMNAIEQLRKTLALWKKKGKTIIIAEHRLYWLKDICDRVIFMKKGEINFEMTMKDFANLNQSETEQLGLRTMSLNQIHSIFQKKQHQENILIKDFLFSYESKRVLNIKSLIVPMNEIIAVIGHNGAGKSTFSKCLCGLEKGFKGTVVMDGAEYSRRRMLKKAYMVMQDVNHQLFCETVEEEIKLGMNKDNSTDVESILENLDLKDYITRHPMSLSGGQKQRVAIASAILADKEVLIFDEPTSGLDFEHMKQTASLLESLRGKRTVFVVTHDPELIMRCCAYVIHIEKGELIDSYHIDQSGEEKLKKFFI